MSWQSEICSRCFTTHPANDQGERLCPKPPVEESSFEFACPGVIWNCSGGTRGFGGGGRIPKTPGMNAGHNPPTLRSLGLTEEDGKALGI